MSKFPEEHFMATVRIGDKGQIVIPKEVREMFGIAPGDTLLLLADKSRGIALPPPEECQKIQNEIFRRINNEHLLSEIRARHRSPREKYPLLL